MKKQVALVYTIITVLMIGMSSCKPDVEVPGQDKVNMYNRIYMPQAQGGVKSYTLSIKPEPDQFILGAAYGGMSYPSKDITVRIKADTSLIEKYNLERRTSYQVLPGNAYSFSDLNVTIPRGNSTSTSLKLSVHTALIAPFTEYMLPVKIEVADGNVAVNEDLQVAYFILKTAPNLKDYEQIDRSTWSVVNFSSEEPAEAAWGNGGQVLHTFDAASSTFWHSKWNGGEATPPHWFIIDMGSSHIMHGLSFLTRQSDNAGKPNEVEIETSMNGVDWSVAGHFNLENTRSMQSQFLTSGFNKEARFFKVTVKSAYNAVYTHLAEIYAF
jgi:hypothetical protein